MRERGKKNFGGVRRKKLRDGLVEGHRSIRLIPLSFVSDLFQGVLKAVLRVLVQGLDAAERDKVGEVGHGGEETEEEKKKQAKKKNAIDEKNDLFRPRLFSLSFETPPREKEEREPPLPLLSPSSHSPRVPSHIRINYEFSHRRIIGISTKFFRKFFQRFFLSLPAAPPTWATSDEPTTRAAPIHARAPSSLSPKKIEAKAAPHSGSDE